MKRKTKLVIIGSMLGFLAIPSFYWLGATEIPLFPLQRGYKLVCFVLLCLSGSLVGSSGLLLLAMNYWFDEWYDSKKNKPKDSK